MRAVYSMVNQRLWQGSTSINEFIRAFFWDALFTGLPILPFFLYFSKKVTIKATLGILKLRPFLAAIRTHSAIYRRKSRPRTLLKRRVRCCQYLYNPNFQFILPQIGMHEQQWESQPRNREREPAGLEGQHAPFGASRGLHEEVIRKNNEIIRNFLSKLNEVFTRQEESDCAMKAVNEKLAKLAQTGDNLQYEFRATYLETSRQQSQLANDIAVVKNALKIPSLATPHEVYLSSDFFRERVNGVNTRMRDHAGRTGLRQRTNAGGSGGGDSGTTVSGSRVSVQKQPIFSNNQNSSSGGKHSKNRSELPPTQPEEQLSKTSEPCLRHSEDSVLPSCRTPTLSPRVQQLQQRLESCVARADLDSSLSLLREELDGRVAALLAERKSECDWNHIDFDELQRYIDSKVEEALTDKVGKKFFENSLTNLKEAWEQEERTIYAAIETRAEAAELAAVKQKLAELCLKLDQPPLQPSLKASTICLNAALAPFTGKHAHYRHRVSARDFHISDSPDTTLIAGRKDEDRRKSRANLQYSNPSSLCRSVEKKETRTGMLPNAVYDDLSASQGMMKERVWREKVNGALGEEKIKKKTKIFT